RLIAAPCCLTAQRAGFAMVLCGRPSRPGTCAHTELRQTSHFRQELAIREPLSILQLLYELCPVALFSGNPVQRALQHKLIDHSVIAYAHLAEVTSAANHRDLDIAIHLLRDTMLRIERCFSDRGRMPVLDAQDAVIAPLIWRMMLLDRHHHTHLCL